MHERAEQIREKYGFGHTEKLRQGGGLAKSCPRGYTEQQAISQRSRIENNLTGEGQAAEAALAPERQVLYDTLAGSVSPAIAFREVETVDSVSILKRWHYIAIGFFLGVLASRLAEVIL